MSARIGDAIERVWPPRRRLICGMTSAELRARAFLVAICIAALIVLAVVP